MLHIWVLVARQIELPVGSRAFPPRPQAPIFQVNNQSRGPRVTLPLWKSAIAGHLVRGGVGLFAEHEEGLALKDELEGEELSLTCRFRLVTAKEDAVYNIVSTCSYWQSHMLH